MEARESSMRWLGDFELTSLILLLRLSSWFRDFLTISFIVYLSSMSRFRDILTISLIVYISSMAWLWDVLTVGIIVISLMRWRRKILKTVSIITKVSNVSIILVNNIEAVIRLIITILVAVNRVIIRHWTIVWDTVTIISTIYRIIILLSQSKMWWRRNFILVVGIVLNSMGRRRNFLGVDLIGNWLFSIKMLRWSGD